jgi:NAD+ kinase
MKLFVFGQALKDRAEFSTVLTLLDAIRLHGHTCCMYGPFAAEGHIYGGFPDGIVTLETNPELIDYQADVAIALGGDGTILRAITLVQDSGIPVLGINLGRLGFLASVEKALIPKAIEQLTNGQFQLVQRSLLQLSSNLPLFTSFPYGLNDFTVNKRDTSSMITVHVTIDGAPLHAYWADGIIVSTPTGSTGYSLSCGGPILFPDAANFIITPVAPHNLTVRPVVIPDDKVIRVTVEGRTDSFMCTLDSRFETITPFHVLEIRKAPFGIRFVQLEGQHFMQTLSEKLLWGLDKRN